MRIAELEMHPADTADRREIAQDDFGLGLCNITKCCTEVCPEHIKITDNALIPMKERVVGRKYDPLVWLGDKIGRRTHKDTPRVPGKASRRPGCPIRSRPSGMPPAEPPRAGRPRHAPDRARARPGRPKWRDGRREADADE